MQSNLSNQEEKSKEYLKDCFMQKCQDELNEYYNNEEEVSDKYSKLAIANMPLISIGVSSSLVLLSTSINFNFVAAIIALSVLVFFVATMLIVRYYLKHKENKNVKLDIYDCWSKTILVAIVVNFGLYIFSDAPHSQMLVILVFATIAMLTIQRGKRSL